jgi:hypothetical protein
MADRTPVGQKMTRELILNETPIAMACDELRAGAGERRPGSAGGGRWAGAVGSPGPIARRGHRSSVPGAFRRHSNALRRHPGDRPGAHSYTALRLTKANDFLQEHA